MRVEDLEGAPLSGIRVGVQDPMAEEQPDDLGWRTGAAGEATLDGLPCGPMQVWAGWSPSVAPVAQAVVELPRDAQTTLRMAAQGLVRVRVEDLHGTPLDGAAIFTTVLDGDAPVGAQVWPDPERPGATYVALPVGIPSKVHVSSFERGPFRDDHHTEVVTVEIALADLALADEDGVVREILVALPIDRVVRVHCQGMPGDSCEGVGPILCTEPLLPLGADCNDAPTVTCICPSGVAAVRGGGSTARVEIGENEVWLDLSYGGAITGRMVEDGEPRSCQALAIRLPERLEDLPRGGLLGREQRCDADGRFTLSGLVPGDWHVELRQGDGRVVRTPPVRVRATPVDIGDIETWSGGGIEGVVLDGLTGDPIPHASVVAMRAVAATERSTPAFGDSDGDGRFSFEGLPPGTWEIFVMPSPFQRVAVGVEEGAITDGVEVRTAEATLLEDNGVELGMDAEGALVVETLDPEGPASRNGLRAGDRVVGVSVMGLDSTTLPPELSETLAAGLLGHWGGPGVDLVIDRDGVLMDVELE